ncbi:hypothetical protein T12_3219 [Trichinella patagoniensis]|uniref:Integrase zinc-binding domain-containing protein n=1 Tax=Trichinella patagoniensis TaxID=990121 RepID=A0A0V0ZVC7_9BILA|nr:hypothetical protein T12_3219 [Trichinella patagoniensis]
MSCSRILSAALSSQGTPLGTASGDDQRISRRSHPLAAFTKRIQRPLLTQNASDRADFRPSLSSVSWRCVAFITWLSEKEIIRRTAQFKVRCPYHTITTVHLETAEANGLLLKIRRIIIPETLRKEILEHEVLHEGHPGIAVMKV